MPKLWSAAAAAAMGDSGLPTLAFLEMDFLYENAQTFLRVCTAAHNVAWNGLTWQGAGTVLEIDALEESTRVEATGLGVRLSAVTPQLLAIAYNAAYQRRPFKMWAAPLDANYQVIAARLIYTGYMDTMSIDDSANAVTLTVEHALSRFNTPPMGHYNHEDQQARYPGMNDKGFEYVSSLDKDTELKWGKA